MERNHLAKLQARLATQFPDWHFWLTRGDRPELMATRKAHITDDMVIAGLARTLPMGVGHNIDLEQQLREQAAIEAQLDTHPELLAQAAP